MSKDLTRRQKQVLDFIDRTQRRSGIFPTLQEIADHFKFASINAVQDHIRALTRKGALEKTPGKARAFNIVSPLNKFQKQIVHIPIYGTIPAGLPDSTDQKPEGCITVDVGTLGVRATARTFALTVRGDSMIGRHICEGDNVICEHGVEPRSGDIVAALIDNESTLKTFVKERRKAYLRAENPAYPDLIPADELVIQGVVTAVIRKMSV